MLIQKVMIIHLVVGLIKRILLCKMSYFPELHTHSKNKIKVYLNLSSYTTKSDLQNVTGIDTSNFAKKVNLVNLKPEVDKIGIDKLGEFATDKLKPVPLDFKKISDVVDEKLLKKMCMMGWLKKLISLVKLL